MYSILRDQLEIPMSILESKAVSTGYKTVKMKYWGIKNIVVVNDGWGNSNINVNMNYVDGCMFLR